MNTQTIYGWTVHSSSDRPAYPDHAPIEGTLEQAVEACKTYGVEIVLQDIAGFIRGFVHPNGTWKLT